MNNVHLSCRCRNWFWNVYMSYI